MLLRHTLQYLPAQIGAPLIQFVTLLLWAHLLPPSEVGVATLVVAIQEITFALIYMWWSHFALRHLSKFRREGADDYLSTEPLALALNVVLQTVTVAVVLGLYFHGRIDGGLFAVILAYIVTRSLNLYLAERARADVKVGLYTLMQVGAPVLGLALGFAAVKMFGPSAASILGAFVISQALCLGAALLGSDVGRARPRLNLPVLKQALAFGIPVMTSSLLAVVALNAPRFIVDATLGLTATGTFAVSYGLGLRASSFAVMLVTAGAYPLVVKIMESQGLEAAYRQLRSNILLVAFVVTPSALGLIAVNESVVRILIPPAFQAAALLVLPLSAVSGMLRYLRSHTTDQVFLLRSRPGYSSLISVADLVLAVGLSFAGVKLFGLAGAVIGPLVAAAFTLGISLYFARYRFAFHFPVGGFLRIAAAGLAMMTATWLLPKTGNPFILVAEIGAAAVIYLLLSALLFPDLVRSQWIPARARLARLVKPAQERVAK